MKVDGRELSSQPSGRVSRGTSRRESVVWKPDWICRSLREWQGGNMSSFLPGRIFRSCIACWGAAGLSACSVGPDFQLPEMGLPKSYIASMNTSKAVPASELAASVNLTQWWRSFRDPQLVSLVERSIAANPEIAIALVRLQQARAQQFGAIGAALPNGELRAGAAYGTGTGHTRRRVGVTQHHPATTH